MWPLLVLFLAMGVASPIWLRAIDTAGTRIAASVTQPPTQSDTTLKLETHIDATEGGQR